MAGTLLGPGGANYFEPAMPASAYKTYALSAPVATHFRTATCQEVNCEGHRIGWTTVIDVATELGRKQSNYIRLASGRSYTVTEIGTLVSFVFAAGQTCFTEHKLKLERDPHFYTFPGDWRGRMGDVQIRRPADWVEDFAEHQDNIKTAIERG